MWGCKGTFALKVTSLSSYGIPPSSYGCPSVDAKIFSPSKLPVSVPMEFLAVPIAARWGCKGVFALKVTSLSSYGILPVPIAAQVGVQRYVRHM